MKTAGKKVLKARSCYEHLGGALGERLFERMLELKWFERDEGARTAYTLSPLGEKMLTEFGVDIYEKKR